MRKTLAFLLLLASAFALPRMAHAADGAVLLWMVSYEDEVTDFGDPNVSTVNDLVSRPDRYQVNGVRIRVGADGSSEYLNMIVGEEGAYEVGGSIAFWDRDYEEAGPAWADLSGRGLTDLFTIELGYFDASDNWTVMAVGDSKTYAELHEFITADPVDDPGYIPWTSSYTVPEPSSGLLMLVGAALLSLRRRTRWA